MKLARFLIMPLLFAISIPAMAANSIRLQGVSGEARQNVQLYLEKFPPAEISGSLRFQSRLRQEIETALQALGYYNSDIDIEVESSAGNALVLHVSITPNQPVHIEQTDIQLSGEAEKDADFLALISSAPAAKQALHHGQYESFKNALLSLALRKGYFDASFTLSRLEVVPELNQAFIRLHFDSGVRYKFGEVTFSGQQISEPRLLSLVPFQAQDHYLARQLGELNQSLANTGWFSSILVTADTENLEDYTLPINVTLHPQRRNIIETGIGYSDDIGARLKLNWNKPWLNSAGHSLNSKLALSEPEQRIEAAYKLPLASVATDFYQVQLGFRNRDNLDTRSQESSLALERHWLLQNNWYRTASIRWLYEDFTQADQSGNSSLILPGISFSRSKQSGETMPRTASRLMIAMEASDKAWASDTRFVRLRGRAGWIGSASDNHRFVTRLDGGAILLESAENLPPSLRFFAGGEGNLRGYAYESVAPRTTNDELIGGRYMLTSSLEYQYRVAGNWWLATFADYGSAWSDKPDWKLGTGVGLRWASPIGPIRLDFAWGLDSGEQKAFQLHFSLGPEL